MTQLNLNGYTDLPDGKVAAIVTHFEMWSPPKWFVETPDDVSLVAIPDPDLAWYRALFLEIGAEWLWFSRLTYSDQKLSDLLAEPGRDLRVVRDETGDLGLLELNFADAENVEVAFFGLVPSAVGRHLGRWLMGEALRLSWARPETKRVWLHTCTLDHPNALPFYMKCGFQPHRRTVEVADDPRLTGAMPVTAGTRQPVLSVK